MLGILIILLLVIALIGAAMAKWGPAPLLLTIIAVLLLSLGGMGVLSLKLGVS
jgi:hypothetical protein